MKKIVITIGLGLCLMQGALAANSKFGVLLEQIASDYVNSSHASRKDTDVLTDRFAVHYAQLADWQRNHCSVILAQMKGYTMQMKDDLKRGLRETAACDYQKIEYIAQEVERFDCMPDEVFDGLRLSIADAARELTLHEAGMCQGK